MCRSLDPRERTPVRNEQEAEWAPKPVLDVLPLPGFKLPNAQPTA